MYELFNGKNKLYKERHLLINCNPKETTYSKRKLFLLKIFNSRPTNKQHPKEYRDCPNCLKETRNINIERRQKTQIASDFHKIADPILKEQEFSVLRNDLCTKFLRKDYLLILYANKLVA